MAAEMKNPVHHEIARGEETKPDSSPRAFGFVFTVFFLGIGLAPTIKGHSLRVWALTTAGVLLICTCLTPRVLILPNKLWQRLGLVLSRFTQPIILGLLFYLVITPIGWLMRRVKGDSLLRKWDLEAKTYWIPRTPPGPDPKSMKHSF